MAMENNLKSSKPSDDLEQGAESQFDWKVEEGRSGERIDKHIAETLADKSVSRSQVQEWIRSGAVNVNGQSVKANAKISLLVCT